MISLYGGKSLRRALKTFTLSPAPILIAALALFAAAPICQAESGSSSSGVTLGKHARKIHREIAHFPTGSYVHLTLADGSERTVWLVSYDDSSFTGTNAESNNRETHAYDEISHVTREKNYIGEGSEGHVRHIRLWVPIAGVLAAGAVATALMVR
jgi:hypothetical protein